MTAGDHIILLLQFAISDVTFNILVVKIKALGRLY